MKRFNDFLWIFLSFGAFVMTISAETLKIGFIIEQIHSNLMEDIGIIVKELEADNHNPRVKDSLLILDRNDLNNSRQELCSMLQDGIAIILDFTYIPWEDGLELIEVAGIPRLQIDKFISPFMTVLSAFLHEKSANDVALIYQNEKDAEEAIYHIVQGYDYRVIILNGMSQNFPDKLMKLRPIPSYYAVFANEQNMNTIFKKIQKFPADFRADRWNFIFTDINETPQIQNEPLAAGSTQLLLNPRTFCKMIRNKPIECSKDFSIERHVVREVIKVIHKIDQTKPILEKRLNCQELGSEEPILNEFDELDTTLRNNKILQYENGIVSYVLNMDIYLIDSSTELLAKWENNQLTRQSEIIKPAKRFLRIGTTEAIPWSKIRRDPITQETILDVFGNPTWEGYCIEFIERLSQKMSFDFVLVPPKKGTFGKRRSDGTWDGLVGDLVTGDTDIVVAALKMLAEREEVIDFVAPYYEQTGISIVIRKAVRQTSLFKFMTVLRLEVWLSIVAALIATAVMIWLLDKYSPYSARNNSTAYPYPCREFSLKECFWFALTSFTPQGGGEAPKAISGRVLVAAYWLFVVLMLATFTANLAAFLTVERMQTPVQSLEQLARQSRINYTVVEESDTHKFFINMKFAEDTLYRMWKELALNATSDQAQYRIWDYPIKEQYGHILLAINSSNPVKDAEEGFQKVNEHENADYAFIHDSAEVKYAISKNCNLTEVGEVFAEQPYAIAVQQGSHLQDEISYAILELQKDRYFEGLTAKYWNSSSSKECSGSEDSEGITLESLGGVFIATIFGLLLAMVTLAGEVIYYRHKHKKERKVGTTIIVKEALRQDPPPSFDKATFRGKKIPHKITLGDEFIPNVQAKARISYLPVYPRNPIRQDGQRPSYYE